MKNETASRCLIDSLEDCDSFDVIGAEAVIRERLRDGFERPVAVRDEFRYVDLSVADQFERFAVDAGAPVGVEAPGGARRRHYCQFDELNVVENAQVYAVMAMPVKLHSRLL